MTYAIPSGVTVMWAGTNATIPAGWSRVTALDGRYVRQIATSVTAPGATGGAATHTHPFSAHSAHTYSGHNHAGSWGTSGTVGAGSENHSGGSGTTVHNASHTHPSSSTAAAAIGVGANGSPANTDTATNGFLNVSVIWISSNGTPTGIPDSCGVYFNGSTPSGWTSLWDGSPAWAPLGAATGADGGIQSGSDTHTHTVATHTHAINNHTHTVALDSAVGGSSLTGGGAAGAGTHTHTIGASGNPSVSLTQGATSETTGSGSGLPNWLKLRAIYPSGTTRIVHGMIAVWTGTLGTIPSRWALCDGTGGTPNLSQGAFMRHAATNGELLTSAFTNATHVHAVGTAHAHTSTGNHTHTVTAVSGAGSTGNTILGGASPSIPTSGHTMASTAYTSPSVDGAGTSSTEATVQNADTSEAHYPLWTGVAYIQYSDPAPTVDAINTPVAGAAYSTTMTLDATVSDSELQACFATFEYDRSDNAWVVIGDGVTVASGGRSTLSWNIAAFTPGNNYRVRVKATDSVGASSTYTTTGTFLVGPALTSLRAYADVGTGYAYYNAVRTGYGIDLLGYWRLGEPSGGALDSSGNGIGNGTYTNETRGGASPTRDSDASVAFVGTGGVAIPVAAVLNQTAAFSVEAWVKCNPGQNGGVFEKTVGGVVNTQFSLFFNNATPNLYWRVAGSGGSLDTTVTLANDGLWHYVVGTYDGTNARLYVDSILVAGPNAVTNPTGGSGVSSIGTLAGIYPFTGSVDEVAVYSVALTSTRIAAHFAAAKIGAGSMALSRNMTSYSAVKN